MKTHRGLFTTLILVALASACSPMQSMPVSTPVPTATFTAVPVDTSTPSSTPGSGWDYVALGDSNPEGDGVEGKSYVPIFADYIAMDLGVEVRTHNLAYGGATSAQLLQKLHTSTKMKQDIREAEIITIDIGANDWSPVAEAYPSQKCGGTDNEDCLRSLVESYKNNLGKILNEITNLHGDESPTLIRVVDLYISDCDFPNFFGDQEVFSGVHPYLDEFNTIIEQTTQTHGGEVVHVYRAFNGPDGAQNPVEYLQPDQCHLNASGHQRVADMLRELGYGK